MSEYPRREPHFAHRFTRLMIKSCLGSQLGPEVCWLLATIAHTEDARRYTSAVVFWNTNLSDQTGLSISALQRARKKAIDAGWLHYIPGAKGKAGTYWVCIPNSELGKPDGPSDESTSIPVQNPGQIDQVNQIPVQNPGQIDQQSGRNPVGIRPTFYPSPIPSPLEDSSEPNSEPASTEQKSLPEEKPKPPTKVKIDPPAEDVVMSFPIVGKSKTWSLSKSKLREWEEVYPHLDALAEFRKAAQWLADNPTRRKTATGMTRFLNSWLSRSQNAPSRTSPPARKPDFVCDDLNPPNFPPMVFAKPRTGGTK